MNAPKLKNKTKIFLALMLTFNKSCQIAIKLNVQIIQEAFNHNVMYIHGFRNSSQILAFK